MKLATVFAGLFLCALAGANARQASKLGNQPIRKVIELMQELKAKVIEEGQQEAIAFDKFMYWCKTNQALESEEISTGKAEDEVLMTTVDSKTKSEKSLDRNIEGLKSDITKKQASQKKSDDQREEEEHLYELSDQDFTDTITAIKDALTALQETHDVTESMLQLPTVQKAISLIQLKGRPDLQAGGDRDAHVDDYQFKSGNVVELLKKLKLQFEDAKQENIRRETNALNAYKLAAQARGDAIKATEDNKEDKEEDLSGTHSDLVQASDDDKVVQEDVEGSTSSLKDITQQCNVKSNEWDERSKTRAAEEAAITQAIEIVSKVSGLSPEPPQNPVPPPEPVHDFLQIGSVYQGSPKYDGSAKQNALLLIRAAARKEKSKALERLAAELTAHMSSPFDKMTSMIQKMIKRLMEEQTSEDEHKHWCDKELEKTTVLKDNKENKVEKLNVEIEKQTAKVNELSSDIKDADDKIAEMTQFMADATEIRQVGKKENEAAIKEAQEAQTALSNALAVLETHYKETGELPKKEWEFIQTKKGKEEPATWDSHDGGNGYKGADGNAKVLELLEATNAEFAQMEAETNAQEDTDQKEFEESMQAQTIEKARRSKESEMKSAEKGRRVDKIATLRSMLKGTSAELDKATQYLTDLQPACVNGDSTYEERKEARDTEIGALREAQGVLQNAFKKSFLQRRK